MQRSTFTTNRKQVKSKMVATDMNSMQSGPPARKSRNGGASPKIKNKKSSFTFIEIPDVPFPLKYHIVLMFSMACRLVKFLLRGSPTWIWKLLQMMTYIIVLFPAFIRFAWFYISCDRVSLCYKTTKHTSRHYLDVYGSKIDTKSGKAVLVYLTGKKKRVIVQFLLTKINHFTMLPSINFC